MIKRIRQRLGFEKLSPYVRRYFRMANMQTATYMSFVIIALEVFMIVSLFVELATGERARSASWFVQHLSSYLLLLAASVFLFIHAYKYTHNKTDNYRRGTYALSIFSVVAIGFGIYISYLDYVKGEQFLTFMTMTIFVTCLLAWKPSIAFLILTVSFILFYLVIDQGKSATYATRINLFMTWVSLIMASFGVYYQHLMAAKKDESLESINAHLESVALHDDLTGIPNMHYFRREAKIVLADPATDPETKRFLFVDIENFKTYNDKYGFREGNAFLKQTAGILEEVFHDVPVARFSDDHFMILADAENMHDRLNVVRKRINTKHPEVYLGLKVGSYTPKKDTDVSIAWDRARYACGGIKKYFDKDYAEYDEEMDRDFHRKQYIVNNIDHALECGYITIYYQPVVWSKNRKICGFEALARWEDPEYGFLSPADFISVLEEYRLIHKLDQYVVKTVCSDIQASLEKYHVTAPVSVNFSFLDFEVTDMLAVCNTYTEEYHVPKEYLHIEITESAMSGNAELLDTTIKRFREAGYSLWLDDFGSGYSSLNVLKDFQFDVMKIDMQFLSNFAANKKAGTILNSIVRLAEQVDMKTLTEGVETEEQAGFLVEIGCERLQGYLFGKPMSRNDIDKALRDQTLNISEEFLTKQN